MRSTIKNHFIFEDGIADTVAQADETYDNDTDDAVADATCDGDSGDCNGWMMITFVVLTMLIKKKLKFSSCIRKSVGIRYKVI